MVVFGDGSVVEPFLGGVSGEVVADPTVVDETFVVVLDVLFLLDIVAALRSDGRRGL
jgi:hypothetical protein